MLRFIVLNRLKASLILAPAVLILLCWLGRFAGVEEVSRIGIFPFILWAAVAAIVTAYIITLYISFIVKMLFKN